MENPLFDDHGGYGRRDDQGGALSCSDLTSTASYPAPSSYGAGDASVATAWRIKVGRRSAMMSCSI